MSSPILAVVCPDCDGQGDRGAAEPWCARCDGTGELLRIEGLDELLQEAAALLCGFGGGQPRDRIARAYRASAALTRVLAHLCPPPERGNPPRTVTSAAESPVAPAPGGGTSPSEDPCP